VALQGHLVEEWWHALAPQERRLVVASRGTDDDLMSETSPVPSAERQSIVDELLSRGRAWGREEGREALLSVARALLDEDAYRALEGIRHPEELRRRVLELARGR
jgi:hypothetical protein